MNNTEKEIINMFNKLIDYVNNLPIEEKFLADDLFMSITEDLCMVEERQNKSVHVFKDFEHEKAKYILDTYGDLLSKNGFDMDKDAWEDEENFMYSYVLMDCLNWLVENNYINKLPPREYGFKVLRD